MLEAQSLVLQSGVASVYPVCVLVGVPLSVCVAVCLRAALAAAVCAALGLS